MNFDTSGDRSLINEDHKNTGMPFDLYPTGLLTVSMVIDTLLKSSDDTIYFKDRSSKFILNNRAHYEQFGVKSQSELAGKSDFDFYPEVFAKQSQLDEMEIMRTGVPIINKMEQGMDAAGQILTFSTSKYPLYDEQGQIIGTWGSSRDMTKLVLAEEELEKANAKLRAISLTDELTGLYNQRHFYDSLKIMIKLYTRRRIGGYTADFCVVFMDIDVFKRINDTYGHVVGDSAIRYIAGLVLAHTRSTDLAFRYGGDEYALILPDTDLAAGRELAERLRVIVSEHPLITDGLTIPITLSIGVACFNNEQEGGEFVQKADVRLYQAKRDGRNRVN